MKRSSQIRYLVQRRSSGAIGVRFRAKPAVRGRHCRTDPEVREMRSWGRREAACFVLIFHFHPGILEPIE
jgi:hypothetical protein